MLDKQCALTAVSIERIANRLPKIPLMRTLVSVIVGIITFVIVDQLVNALVNGTNWKFTYGYLVYDHELWIVSPSGKTTAKLPFFTALRVVRKRRWRLVETAPICKVTRGQAFKILLLGDR